MKERIGLILLAAILLSACNEEKETRSSSSDSRASYSVFGQIRPKVDPAIVRQIEQEDIERQRAKQAELERQLAAQNQPQESMDPSQRNLPAVNMSPIAGTVQPVSGNSELASAQAQPMDTASWQPPAGNMQVAMAPSPPPVSSYNTNYTTPSPGFVPPPPAVTVSGSMAGAPPPPEMYAQAPYPYYQPYPQQYQPPVQEKPQRAPGSLFGSSRPDDADDDDDQPARRKKDKNVVLITPTGMPPQSPFRQKDDLKALWQGVLSTSLSSLMRDEKVAQQLKKVEVAVPGESTRGMLTVSQRTIDTLFKNATVDKKFLVQVKKSQTELIQSYYRYLFSYNKFSLSQQNVAARKQEIDLAESSAEKQRAAADLAQAQQEAESSKEDMRSAQNDLAAVAGAQAARLVIGRISGVAPSLESLAQAEPQVDQQSVQSSIGGFFNSVGSAFGFGKKQEGKPEEKVAKAEITKSNEKDKEKERGKDKKKGKADTYVAAAPQELATPVKSTSVESAAVSPAPTGAVSFELKDVKTTPRKAVLRVSIRNNGDDSFSFDTDSVSVSDGPKKLAEASVRAEFDATVIQPNHEVIGTITIYGQPWNDRLSVSLSDGGKTILLHR